MNSCVSCFLSLLAVSPSVHNLDCVENICQIKVILLKERYFHKILRCFLKLWLHEQFFLALRWHYFCKCHIASIQLKLHVYSSCTSYVTLLAAHTKSRNIYVSKSLNFSRPFSAKCLTVMVLVQWWLHMRFYFHFICSNVSMFKMHQFNIIRNPCQTLGHDQFWQFSLVCCTLTGRKHLIILPSF